MNRAARNAAWVNAGWMAFVWVTRIRNAAGDDQLSTTAAALAYALSAIGLIGAAVLVAAAWKGIAVWLVVPVAVIEIVIWVVRGTTIALGDRAPGFKAVHVVLAAISVALAAWLISEVGRRAPLRP